MRDAVVLDASIGPPSSASGRSEKGLRGGQDVVLPTPDIASSAMSRLIITAAYTNINNQMHGGAAAVIFDMLTTIALGPLARPGYWEWVAPPPPPLFNLLPPNQVGQVPSLPW